MAEFCFKTRVSYDDIDQNLHLTLRGALSMMQESAIIHSDLLGYSVRNVEETHVIWMLVQWRVRLIGTAVWNENVTVRTWPTTMERATSERDFEIVDEAGEIVAIGESLWVLVNADTGRIVRIPQQVKECYELTARRAFDDEIPEISCDTNTETYSCVVSRRDIDTNHHVNNRVYLDYAREAIPELPESGFREVTVHYRKQLLMGQNVHCFYSSDGVHHKVDICSDDESSVHASVVYK